MSVDPSEPEASTSPIALRREALLPNERGRGLGTVAVVCTMAGVASGLALATTLMAMQVADSMAMRPTIHVVTPQIEMPAVDADAGFLGIRYVFHDGIGEIKGVLRGTPAEAIGLHAGDHVVSIDGDPIRTDAELQNHIFGSRPGSELTLVIERDGAEQTFHPVLTSWPVHGRS